MNSLPVPFTPFKPCSQQFFKSLTGNKEKDSALIGQFGVGFYSSFVVADKVVVITKKVGLNDSEGVIWSSKGDGKFSIENVSRSEHGCEIILYLKKTEVTGCILKWTLTVSLL